jgi:RNA polymerase sigma-54 factor
LIFNFDKDGKISTRLNDLALPKMLTDDAMFSAIKTIENDQHASTYYHDCYRGAASFIIAMQKRANTLLQIGQILAKRQEKFILTGRKLHRKPLTMVELSIQ